MMIRRRARGLDNKNVSPANILFNLNESLSIGKRADCAFTKIHLN